MNKRLEVKRPKPCTLNPIPYNLLQWAFFVPCQMPCSRSFTFVHSLSIGLPPSGARFARYHPHGETAFPRPPSLARHHVYMKFILNLVVCCNRHSSARAKCLACHFKSWRRLPSFIFILINCFNNPLHHILVKPIGNNFFC